MQEITWDDFEKVELRVGTILEAEEFPEARKPMYKLTVDFGEEVGVKKSSGQMTAHYQPEDLVGKQVVGLLNLPPKQIGPFVSEFLTTGFDDGEGNVVLIHPERSVPNGSRLF